MLHGISKKSFRIQIENEWWVVSLFTTKEFVKLHGEGCVGVTWYNHDAGERDIHFKIPASKDTIVHELMHAYLSRYPFERRSRKKIEEDICELVGNVHHRLQILANEIYREFKKSR